MGALKRFVAFCMVPAAVFTSCSKEELPAEAFPRGEIITASVFMETDYRYQIYYHLERNELVRKHLRTDWDIAFSCGSDNLIYLNTTCVAQAAPAQTGVLHKAEADLAQFRPDHPSGNPDSLALKGCLETPNAWVIDRGYDPSGNPIGRIQIRFEMRDENTYRITYLSAITKDTVMALIPKDSRYNTVSWSFKNDALFLAEPEKTSYDLCFTTYTNVFYNPYMPYLVNGVWLNPQISGVADSSHSFSDLSLEHIQESAYTLRRDVIGYDWKEYSFTSASYVIHSQKNYVVRSISGFYYKLHFIDFYNEKGEKGNPKFEFKLL